MATAKMIERVQRMISQPEQIRNICTSAHIHHGKTAFTDNLLAASGFMSTEAAGDLEKGMATWQHADEQERLMTVDAANVSMVHDFQGKEFLINLIDTPGHVDFGGNVTRAMRAIDGTIVLICGSEGIMPQTITVVKQALRERVKPVLFINKVDRLINELQLTPVQMQERFTKIIMEFNKLIEDMAEPEFREKWQVKIQDGSVAFGSARENWALSLPYMIKKGVGFQQVINMYKMSKEDRDKWVWANAPLHEVILDMAVNHLPNPKQAQVYRVGRIWKGDFETQFGKDLLTCNSDGKLAFCITRILIDQKSGREICAGRLYSGTMKEGMQAYLNGIKGYQKIQNVYMYLGTKIEPFTAIPSGNVLAVAGISAFAGETITEQPEHPFEELKHVFEPVITKSIEVLKPQDLPKLVEVLKKVGKEDPSVKIHINDETGEVLISGMGELHLEIIEGRIVTEKGLQIKTSPPVVVYRESVTKPGTEEMGKSPNKHNALFFKVEPLDPETLKRIRDGTIPSGRVKKRDVPFRNLFVDCGWDIKQADAIKDVYNGNVFVEMTKGQVHIGEIIEMVLDMFEDVMRGGSLAREPCFGVKVTLTDCKLHEDGIHRGMAQIYPCVREGIRLGMSTAGAVLYEPLQIEVIEAPVTYVGEVSKLIGQKRGQMLEMNQEGNYASIKAKLPVAEMLGWSSALRSATEGHGSSSMVDQVFERLPSELQPKVVGQIVQRKGLTAGQLG